MSQINRVISLTEFLALLTVVLNLLAFVWAASKIATKLDNLIEAFGEHKKEFTNIKNNVTRHGEDIAAIKGSLGI